MAIYDNLPVFKASYDLMLSVCEVTRHISRDYRYTLGEDLKKRLVDIMLCIYKANSVQNAEKESYIRQAREYVVEVKLYIRLLHDLGQLPTKRMGGFILLIESISKQLTAWAKGLKQECKGL